MLTGSFNTETPTFIKIKPTMRVTWIVLSLLLFVTACKENKTPLSSNEPVNSDEFFNAFTALKLPYEAADTSLSKIGDTTAISYHVLEQFVPDTALQNLPVKDRDKLLIHPVGKIKSGDDVYMLVKIRDGKKTSLVTFLFNKKNQYLNHLLLINNRNSDDYLHTVNINSEPTFLISKTKTDNNQYAYTKTGYAYSNESKSFIEVINESNEDKKKRNEILNPVDTLAKKNKYSADYTKSKTNFISVRDGSNAGSYIFFIHFNKNEGDCTGELKGTLRMTNTAKGVFQQSGDPCVIDFDFSGNNVKVKERGSCGNHRGMDCMFDDTYKRKKEEVKKTDKKR